MGIVIELRPRLQKAVERARSMLKQWRTMHTEDDREGLAAAHLDRMRIETEREVAAFARDAARRFTTRTGAEWQERAEALYVFADTLEDGRWREEASK